KGESVDTLLWRRLGIRDEELLCILPALVVPEFGVRGHLIHLSGHSFDVFDNQLVKIGIREFTADAKSLTHGKLVLLVEIKDVNVLVDSLSNRPGYGNLDPTIGGGADDCATAGHTLEIFFGLAGVEGFKEKMHDNPSCYLLFLDGDKQF